MSTRETLKQKWKCARQFGLGPALVIGDRRKVQRAASFGFERHGRYAKAREDAEAGTDLIPRNAALQGAEYDEVLGAVERGTQGAPGH